MRINIRRFLWAAWSVFVLSKGVGQDLLRSLTLPRDGKIVHISSWDRSGGNADARAIEPGGTHTLLDLKGPGVIRRIWITVAPEETTVLRQAVIRFYWDDEKGPSVQTPLGDFFGAAFGQYVHYISLPLSMTSGGYNCYWQMPFRKSARITVTNESDRRIDALYYNIDVEMVRNLPLDTLYFHAQWRRENPTQPGKNYTVLETTGRGHVVGVLLEMQIRRGRGIHFLEGDEMVYVDGEAQPSVYGTGTEDYLNSGWYFNRGTFYAPFHGCIVKDERMGRICAYRWHIMDPISFKQSIRFTIEHGHANEVVSDYSSVAYWYQSPPRALPPLPPPADRLPYVPPPPRKIQGVIEGESLLSTAKATQGQVTTQEMFGFGEEWSDGIQLWWTGGQPGARLTLTVNVPADGRYTIAGYFTKARDYGTFQLYVNGQKIGQSFNGYNPQVVHSGKVVFGTADLKAGANEFTLEITGKDDRSVGYLVGIDGWEIAR